MPYLKSSDPSTDPADIEEAFRTTHDGIECVTDVFFEHGQWFIRAIHTEEITYSVVDAQSDPDLEASNRKHGIHNGFAFEELG